VQPDDHVCLCFHVSLRKVRTYLAREDPAVASLISECLGAGTGCGWCVPFLKHLHAEHAAGRKPGLRITPEDYAGKRTDYRKTGQRPNAPGTRDAGDEQSESPGEHSGA